MIFIEMSYLFSLIIESLKAFDEEGDGNFETSWQKTTKRYWSTFDFKISFVNLFPIGLLGEIRQVPWMRIFWILKVYRLKHFLRLFQYQTYNRFIRAILSMYLKFKERGRDKLTI